MKRTKTIRTVSSVALRSVARKPSTKVVGQIEAEIHNPTNLSNLTGNRLKIHKESYKHSQKAYKNHDVLHGFVSHARRGRVSTGTARGAFGFDIRQCSGRLDDFCGGGRQGQGDRRRMLGRRRLRSGHQCKGILNWIYLMWHQLC